MAKKQPDPRRLNPEQQRVVDHVNGPLRVGAGAGSGKTHALIERAATLIERHGVSTNKILLISFSVNARKEMEKRMAERLPGRSSSEICRTFHSIGLDIFREEVDQSKSWFIDTTSRLWRKAIRAGAKNMGIDLGGKGSIINMKTVESVASLAKTQMLISDRALRKLGRIDPGLKKVAVDIAGEHIADDVISIIHAAEDIREVTGIEEQGMYQNFLTFDDMLYAAATLLRSKNVKERWAHRWKFVMQDEAQDASLVRDEIAEALCSVHRNYMIVGDPAQAIFSFAGASPERMLAFDDAWPGATTVVMNRNYRSGIEVIEAANRVMAKMPPGTVIAESMKCERQTRAYVGCHVFVDDVAEADAIAGNIRAHFDQGVAWKEQAIVVRSNFMVRPIEVSLARSGIPYRIVSGESFFQMTEASIMLGYLRVALNRATRKDVETTLSNPGRMLGKVYFEALGALRESKPDVSWTDLALLPQLGRKQSENVEEWQALISQIAGDAKRLAPYQILKWLVEVISLDEWLKGDNEADNAPTENIGSVLDFAAYYGTATELLDAVDKILEHKKASSRLRNVVEVSTIHRYKGREAAVVYMPGLGNFWFPASRGNFLEERRLFYVGITRAMDELWISYPREEGVEPSVFIAEAGLKVLDGDTIQPGRKIQPTKIGTQMVLI